MGSSIGHRPIIRFFYKNNCEKCAVHLGNTVITWCCVNYSDRRRLAAIRLRRPCESQLKPTPHVYSEIRSNCGNRGRQEDGCERLSITLGSFRKDGFRGKSRFGSFTRRAAGGWRGYTPHSLRTTTATLLLDAGVDIIKVKELLGHRQVTTTQIYDKRRRNFKEGASHDMPI
jgi:integrase